MKYIFTFALIILLSVISHAEAFPSAPQPIPKPTSPIKLDEYGKISFKEEKKRLKPAAEELKNYEDRFGDMYLLIIYYGEKCSTARRVNNAKNYLIKKEGIEPDKISTIYGGVGETKTEIYLPPGKPPADEPNTDLIKEPDCQVKRKRLKKHRRNNEPAQISGLIRKSKKPNDKKIF